MSLAITLNISIYLLTHLGVSEIKLYFTFHYFAGMTQYLFYH